MSRTLCLRTLLAGSQNTTQLGHKTLPSYYLLYQKNTFRINFGLWEVSEIDNDGDDGDDDDDDNDNDDYYVFS